MKRKKCRICLGLLLCLVLAGETVRAEAPWVKVQTFEARSPEETFPFEEELMREGERFRLQEVQYTVLDQEEQLQTEIFTEQKIYSHRKEGDAIPAFIHKDGRMYFLQAENWNYTPVTGQTEEVHQQVTYFCQEKKPSAPETVISSMQGEGYPLQDISLSLMAVQKGAPYWIQDLSCLLIVEDMSAYGYYLGDILCPIQEVPALDLAPEILELLELSPETHRIASLRWEGEAYLGADGCWKRQILGEGSRLVCDYTAEYTGTAWLPELPEWRVEAAYQASEQRATGVIFYTIQARALYQKAEEDSLKVPWAAVTPILLFGVLLPLWKKRKSKNPKKT